MRLAGEPLNRWADVDLYNRTFHHPRGGPNSSFFLHGVVIDGLP
jgi:hypothetical protein